MAAQLRQDGNCLVISPSASVVTEAEAKECVAGLKSFAGSCSMIVFDFSAVTEITSTALRSLAFAVGVAGQKDAQLGIVSSKALEASVLDRGMGTIFLFFGSMDEARSAAAGGGSRADELVKTTLEAVSITFRATTNTEVRAGKAFSRTEASQPRLDIGAVVGLVGQNVNGSILLGMPMATFLGLMSRMFGTEFTEVVPDIADGPAEFLNIILGHVKTTLNARGYGIKQAIPSVLTGTNLRVMPATAGPSLIIPFQTEAGEFYVELTMISEAIRLAA